MERVDAHTHPAWKAMADQEIIRLARLGIHFNAQDVTDAVGLPARPNAVGARFSAASRRGIIVPVGYAQSTRPDRHASRMLVWQGTERAQAVEPPIPLTPPRETLWDL